jgi:RNA polymerase sigma-70 factor (ECF subfamily)
VRRTTEAIYEELLALRCQRGEKAALEELVRNWEKRLFYFIRRLVDNEADAWDVLQQTWVRVLSGIGRLREPHSLGPWLYQIARHAALSQGEVNANYRRLLHNYAAAPPADEDVGPEEFNNAERVHRGLLQLSLPHREVLTLFFLEAFSIEAIAQIVEVPPGTVKSRLYYAKKALRAALEKEEWAMPPEPSLRDRLCGLEPQTPLLRERYLKEIQAMLERKLRLGEKLFVAVVSVVALGQAAYLAVLAGIHGELPVLARVGLAGGALFSVAFAVLGARTLRRGTWELRIQPAAIAGLVWVFAVLLETCFLVLAPQFPDHFLATVALFSGLVLLVGAGVMLVNARVEQAELRTREALLRLEYRLAELSEGRTGQT